MSSDPIRSKLWKYEDHVLDRMKGLADAKHKSLLAVKSANCSRSICSFLQFYREPSCCVLLRVSSPLLPRPPQATHLHHNDHTAFAPASADLYMCLCESRQTLLAIETSVSAQPPACGKLDRDKILLRIWGRTSIFILDAGRRSLLIMQPPVASFSACLGYSR
jgi:hypothetical protein